MGQLGLKVWARIAVCLLTPMILLNLAVAFFGSSFVSPFSPFHLREKVKALTFYARHRPGCLFSSHPAPGPLVAATEKKYQIPRGLLAALIEVESETRPHRISFAGAMGLGQLVPATAEHMGLDDPFDSATAIDASGHYLGVQLKRTKSAKLALAAYNAGPGNVHGSVPQNGETELYVAKVMRAWKR